MLPLAVVALLLAAPLPAPGPEAPDGCAWSAADRYACAWETNGPTVVSSVWAIPRSGTSLVRVEIEAELPSPYTGWTIRNETSPPVAQGFLDPTESATEGRWLWLVELDPATEHFLLFSPTAAGTYRIRLDATVLAEGEPSGGTAGSPTDPQLVDGVGDYEGDAWLDIAGAWWDDPRRGDGRFEAGLVVPALGETPDDATPEYNLFFDVLGERYTIRWIKRSLDGRSAPEWHAELRLAGRPTEEAKTFLPARLAPDEGLLHVTLADAILGSPPDGAPFDGFLATSSAPVLATGSPTAADTASTQVRAFALGGPDVWAALRGQPRPTPDPEPDATPPLLLLGILAAVIASAGVAAAYARRPRSKPTPAPAPGVVFLGRYHIDRRLGAGAFGEAWLADHLHLKRKVVLKRLHPEWTHVDEARERFRQEARILASLDHPCVTRTHDAELADDTWYLVLEYVAGGNLEDRLTRGPLPPDEARRILADILDGLAYIHERGVLHRDLKPANILLTPDGRAKVADFGIARSSGPDAGLTASGASPGTPLYMAPEQLRAEPADERADLYALGALAHLALAGRPYLDVDPQDFYALQRAIVEAPPRPAPEIGAFEPWIARALAKEKSGRWASARQMREAMP